MKFLYEFRTKENVLKKGVVCATNRDKAYAILKATGIKPSRVEEAPGILNKIFGKGKRWLVIFILSVTSTALLFALLAYQRKVQSTIGDSRSAMPRHQIYGDPARMEEFDRDGYSSLFKLDGDRILARFVQPGVLVSVPSERDVVARRKMAASIAEAIKVSDDEAIVFDSADTREASEVKRSVLWIRQELRRYLSNGIGTTETYLKRLSERQVNEYNLYNRIAAELKLTDDAVIWNARNETLRSLGLRTISRPDGLDNL